MCHLYLLQSTDPQCASLLKRIRCTCRSSCHVIRRVIPLTWHELRNIQVTLPNNDSKVYILPCYLFILAVHSDIWYGVLANFPFVQLYFISPSNMLHRVDIYLRCPFRHSVQWDLLFTTANYGLVQSTTTMVSRELWISICSERDIQYSEQQLKSDICKWVNELSGSSWMWARLECVLLRHLTSLTKHEFFPFSFTSSLTRPLKYTMLSF